MSIVRTRFAPSPTGILHLGGLRTALFNFLVARQNGGQFVLRIEDTDQKRLVPDSQQTIFDVLEWTKLTPDEGPLQGGKYGPYTQSQRTTLYQSTAFKLLDSDHAYRCFCSPKRLEMLGRAQKQRGENPGYDKKCRTLTSAEIEERLRRQEPYMIRFKLDETDVVVKDTVFGDVKADLSGSESDPVLLKSDGFPVYHLANVVDDHYMEISHVIRGSEWLPSTPKHVLLYDALGWKAPVFAHVPLLLNEKGQKLSKRNPDYKKYELDYYRRKGYLPQTLLNWLLSSGGGFTDEAPWFPGMSVEDLIDRFRVDLLTRRSAQLDFDKLQSCGQSHFEQLLASEEGRASVSKEAERRFAITSDEQHRAMSIAMEEVLPHRVSCFADLHQFLFLWRAPNVQAAAAGILAHSDPGAAAKVLEEAAAVVAVGGNLEDLSDADLPKGTAMRVLRIALFGAPSGPRVSQLVQSLHSEEVIRRMKAVITQLGT